MSKNNVEYFLQTNKRKKKKKFILIGELFVSLFVNLYYFEEKEICIN